MGTSLGTRIMEPWSYAERTGALLAAHAMLWNDDYLHQIEKDFGDKTAQLVARSHKTAIDTMEEVCALHSPCPFVVICTAKTVLHPLRFG